MSARLPRLDPGSPPVNDGGVDALPAWAGSAADIDRPNSARMYDYLLGGSYNFAADRAAANPTGQGTG